ncbi:DUF2239 family protein [Deinococcus deserti]|uniref:DUF2239 family protein n=1 Tax=Deinococcus deserti TaxID=310783 RepID=UPI0039EA388C
MKANRCTAARRRLTDEAHKASPSADQTRLSCRRTDRCLMRPGVNLPGREEANRTLYAGDGFGFHKVMLYWRDNMRHSIQWFVASAFPQPQRLMVSGPKRLASKNKKAPDHYGRGCTPV